LSKTLDIHNGLKQGDNCYIREVQENPEGLKLILTHQLLVSAEYSDVVGEIISKRKDTKTLLDATKEVGLEVNEIYMLMSRHQNAGQNRNIKMVNRFPENVAKFKYLGTTVIYHNYIHEEINSRLT
jgi:hypothetical protein